MSKIIGKVIYLPSVYDGKKHGHPEIIHVSRYLFDIVQGSRFPEEVEQGRRGSYQKSRCLAYSDETWELCQTHIKTKIATEKNYKNLEKLARRVSNQRNLGEL